MKKLSIVFFFILLTWVSPTQTKWTAEDLNLYYTKQNHPPFIDPESYVKSDKTIHEINSLIKLINSEKSYDTNLFIISEMSDKYKSYFSVYIDLFLNDLSYLIYQGDESKDADSCFILISIKDKLMRIRTGKNVRYYISDTEARNYLRSIMSLMRSEDYGAASQKLLEQIRDRVINGNPYLEKVISWIIMSVILIGFSIVLIFTCLAERRKYYLTPSAQERLEKIKLISLQNKTKKEIVQTTCVICLEDLKIEPNERIENLLVTDKQVSLCEVSTLQCGHSFHSVCISSWMNRSNNCPTCRHQIDNEENARRVGESLILVQTIYHPNLANYAFNYSNGFAWHRNTGRTGNSGGSSYFRSWGRFGGGATSSW